MAWAVIGVVALLANQASGVVLRQNRAVEPATTPLPGDPDVHAEYDYLPRENPATVTKYTEAESVSQVLFVMACKAKHKNDIDGKTRDAAKDNEYSEKEFADHLKGLQTENVGQMKETCDLLNTKYEKECHEGCTAKWATGGAMSLPEKKKGCTDACNLKHKNWGEECLEKVENLKNVYVQEQGNIANQKKCLEMHCPLFPAVLTTSDDSEAEKIKEDGCKEECTEKGIKAQCVKKWNLEVDMQIVKIQSDCESNTKKEKLEPCMKDGIATVDGDHDTCKTDGTTTCEDKHKACMDEAKAAGEKTMVGAHADSICGTRKDNCIAKVEAKCKKTHEKALVKLDKKCKMEFKEAQEKCEDDKLKEAREKFEEKCKTDTEPTCKDDCSGKCTIKDLRECQKDMLEKSFGVTAEYCTKLWDWIFASEQYDSKTLDPIPKATGGGRFKNVAPKRLMD